MSKSALGRGLGSLLSSRPRPATQSAPVEGQSQRAEVTPGVAALIQGGRETHSATGSETRASASTKTVPAPPDPATQAVTVTAMRSLLFGADLLLCLLAFLFVHRSATVQFHELLLCAVAVIVGGSLSWVAFCTKAR